MVLRPDQVDLLFHGSGGSVFIVLLKKKLIVWVGSIHVTCYRLRHSLESMWRKSTNMAAASFAWLSVVVKWVLLTVIPRRVVKTGWENTFGELLAVVEPGFKREVIDKVTISTNERFADPVHEVDVSAPVSVCDIFNYRFVCIFMKMTILVS